MALGLWFCCWYFVYTVWCFVVAFIWLGFAFIGLVAVAYGLCGYVCCLINWFNYVLLFCLRCLGVLIWLVWFVS